MPWSHKLRGSNDRFVEVRRGFATTKEAEIAAQEFATGPLKKLDQPWALLLEGILLLAAAVVLVFLVLYQ